MQKQHALDGWSDNAGLLLLVMRAASNLPRTQQHSGTQAVAGCSAGNEHHTCLMVGFLSLSTKVRPLLPTNRNGTTCNLYNVNNLCLCPQLALYSHAWIQPTATAAAEPTAQVPAHMLC
jgi:hypothetical protein